MDKRVDVQSVLYRLFKLTFMANIDTNVEIA